MICLFCIYFCVLSFLECHSGQVLFKDECVSSCPLGYFVPENASVCIGCHYSCKSCFGSSDYECLECYPDYVLVNATVLEQFCYPRELVSKLNFVEWYYRTYVLLICILVFLVCAFVYLAIKNRKSKYKWQQLMQIESLNTIRNLEKNVKTTVYTDSE